MLDQTQVMLYTSAAEVRALIVSDGRGAPWGEDVDVEVLSFLFKSGQKFLVIMKLKSDISIG